MALGALVTFRKLLSTTEWPCIAQAGPLTTYLHGSHAIANATAIFETAYLSVMMLRRK